MAADNLEGWAVDLADVGAVYPFQGTEVVLVVAGVVAWLVWHVWQLGAEKRKYEAKIREYGTDEHVRRALEND